MIEIKNITKTYPSGATPFQNLSLTINDGDVITLIGPSGTGKSTLLRCINLLDKPTTGNIFIDGVDITLKSKEATEALKEVGMVFQSFNLFPHLTILENIMMPQMDILKRSKQESFDKAISLLKDVGLYNQRFQYPSSLSGGQKQRVAIARTLAMDRKYILLDEPTSALDPTMVGEIENVIKRLAKKGITMLIVTHEMKFAKEVSNRVIFLSDGAICEDGTPDQIFNNPINPKTKRFINNVKELEITINNENCDILSSLSKVSEFSSNCGLSDKTISKILSCYEELVINTLFDKIKDLNNIIVKFEYYEREDKMVINVSYQGSEYNPLNEDELSIILLKHNSSSTNYEYNNINNIQIICECK